MLGSALTSMHSNPPAGIRQHTTSRQWHHGHTASLTRYQRQPNGCHCRGGKCCSDKPKCEHHSTRTTGHHWLLPNQRLIRQLTSTTQPPSRDLRNSPETDACCLHSVEYRNKRKSRHQPALRYRSAALSTLWFGSDARRESPPEYGRASPRMASWGQSTSASKMPPGVAL